MTGWTVLRDESLSDHNYLAYKLEAQLTPSTPLAGWSFNRLEKCKFITSVEKATLASNESAADSARALVDVLTRGMNYAAPRKPAGYSKWKSVHC